MDKWEQLRQLDLMLSISMIGMPYVWAGQDPDGCDCSGFRVMTYRKLKIIGPQDDHTAQGFWNLFGERGLIMKAIPGSLTVYGPSFSEITHIAFNLTEELSLDAPGGTSRVVAPDPDIYFDIHSINRRSDLLGFCDPYLHLRKTQE